MTEHRVTLQQALVLHQRPYGDTSSLVEIFSKDFGRVSAIAKGARQVRSNLRSILQPFQLLLVSWSGKGEIKTLTHAEFANKPLLLQGERLVSGLYVNELILKLLMRFDSHEILFTRYIEFLHSLSRGVNVERPLRLFENYLLAELGYNLVLATEADHQTPIVPGGLYRYVMEHGPVPVSTTEIGGLVIHGKNLLALANGDLTDDREQQIELKKLLRSALQHCLGDKTLNTRTLMRALHRPSE